MATNTGIALLEAERAARSRASTGQQDYIQSLRAAQNAAISAQQGGASQGAIASAARAAVMNRTASASSNASTASKAAQTSPYQTYTDPVTGKQFSVAPAGAGGYMQQYTNFANQQMAQRAKDEANYLNQYNANNATTNSNYDSAQRQAYVDYVQKQKALPSQLQGLGVRGGATESGLMNLYNQYGAEHAANEQQRAAELAQNKSNYDQTLYDYSKTWQEKMDDALNKAMTNQMNEYNNELTKYSTSIARFTADKAGYNKAQKELQDLKNGNDPLKNDKIRILEAEIARVFTAEVLDNIKNGDKKSSGGGGGSSKKRRSGYSSGGGGGGNTTASDSKYKSMDDYYRTNASKMKSYKNKKTTTVSSKKKSRGYNIKGETSKNWQ